MILEKSFRNKLSTFFICSGFLLLFLLGFCWYNVISFNNNKRKLYPSSDEKVKISLTANSETSDKWTSNIKDFFDPSKEDVYIGETSSCNIENSNTYDITDWNIKFTIKQNCYLNGFWCGDFEVHQFRNNQEIVERINTTKVDPAALKLEVNKNSNNLMIRLIPGDYLVYYPSEEAREDVVRADSSVGIGFIFYYKGLMDLTDYELIYRNDLNLTNVIYFKVIVVLIIIWGIGLIFFYALIIINRKYIDEMNQSIRNISIMAELYHEVHMINLDTNSGYLIKGKPETRMFNFVGKSVSECFEKYINEDCREEYKSQLKDFLDFDSIRDMLKTTASISIEYRSKKYGWCLLRFIKTEKGSNVSQLIFTIQDLNNEKDRLREKLEISKQNEYVQVVRSKFIGTFAMALDALIEDILKANREIAATVENVSVLKHTSDIENSSSHFRLIQKCIIDMFDLESNSFELKNEKYDFYKTVEELLNSFRLHYENKNFEFIKSIDEGIPEYLEGDITRLKQIIMLILVSSFMVTEKGFVKFSVFAKTNGDMEELLFSVKDTANGFTEEQINEIYDFLDGKRINTFGNPSLVFLKIIDGILKNMGSKLKVVTNYGTGSEFYFTVQQKIAGKDE